MTKRYIYRVGRNGRDYFTLDDAVSSAVDDFWVKDKASKPFVAKVYGGYMVVVIARTGQIYTRMIDVFEPKPRKNVSYVKDNGKNEYNGYGTGEDETEENEQQIIDSNDLLEEDDDYVSDERNYNDGYDDGYEDGLNENYAIAYEQGIKDGQAIKGEEEE
jgi:hypothetical protein